MNTERSTEPEHRPGNTPVEQQERDPRDTESTRHDEVAITGPGASDFLTAPTGLDVPESGGKGMAQTRDEGPLDDAKRLAPRLGPDDATAGASHPKEEGLTGSQTGTIGGGGLKGETP
jgi:hypothetical protein